MTLEILAELIGTISAAIVSLQALRASTLYRRAHDADRRGDRLKGTRAGHLFKKSAMWLNTEAGWRPRDHYLLVCSIAALAVSFLLSLIAKF